LNLAVVFPNRFNTSAQIRTTTFFAENMKFIARLCCCFFPLIGCQSDSGRLHDAERRFMKIVAVPEKRPLTAGKDTLFLPVLPAPEHAQQARAAALELQASIREVDSKKLENADQKRLDALSRATEDLVSQGVSIPLEQVGIQVAEPFRQVLKYKNPELTRRFLEQLPTYVAEMEQRWPTNVSSKNPDIARAAESAYDALLQLEQESPAELEQLFATARLAWKDYIGLCQSNLLTRQ
jgi:hypothetical protein